MITNLFIKGQDGFIKRVLPPIYGYFLLNERARMSILYVSNYRKTINLTIKEIILICCLIVNKQIEKSQKKKKKIINKPEGLDK